MLNCSFVQSNESNFGNLFLIREKKSNFEAITRGLVYSIQKHVNSSIPTLDRYRHERYNEIELNMMSEN